MGIYTPRAGSSWPTEPGREKNETQLIILEDVAVHVLVQAAHGSARETRQIYGLARKNVGPAYVEPRSFGLADGVVGRTGLARDIKKLFGRAGPGWVVKYGKVINRAGPRLVLYIVDGPCRAVAHPIKI